MISNITKINLLIFSSLAFIVIYPFIKYSVLIFPVDDAYIVFKQAEQLLNGNFFQYSPDDAKVNACTSFILYIFYSIIWFISSLIFETKLHIVNFSVFLVLFCNLFFFCIYLFFLKKLIFQNFEENPLYIYFFLSSIFSISYIFFFGLETGITLLILIVQFYTLSNKKYSYFLLITLLASFNRPENLVLNFFLLIYLKIFIKDFKNINLILILLSITMIPLINYFNFSDIKTTSAARVDHGQVWFSFLNPKNLYYSLVSFFAFIPSELIQYKFRIYFILSKITYLSIITYIFYKIFMKIKKLISQKKLNSFFEDHKIYLFLFFIIGYGSLPFIFEAHGEHGRYYLPIICLFFIFLFKLYNPQNKILFILIAFNFFQLPFLGMSHTSNILHMKSLYYDNIDNFTKYTNKESITALEVAGLPSLFINGKVIDVYGLGTKRYADVHRNYNLIYKMLREEKITNFLAFTTDKKYYFDMGHFKTTFPKKNFIEIFSNKQKDLYNEDKYLLNLGFFKLEN